MSESYSKSQLDAMRVSDLKVIAQADDIDVTGMKKADLIDAIMNVGEDEETAETLLDEAQNRSDDVETEMLQADEIEQVDESSESDSVEDVEEEEEENIEAAVEAVPEPQSIEIDSSEDEKPSDSSFTQFAINIVSPVLFYKDRGKRQVIAKTSGIFYVQNQSDNMYVAEHFIPGLGPTVGFVDKFVING